MRAHAQICTAVPAIAWEECACLLCGSPRLAPLLEGADPHANLRFLIVRCERCGLCFTNPRPDAESIRRFYAADYRCHQSRDDAKQRPEPLAKLLPMRGQKRLLDFGCGGGAFLQRMHAVGWNVVGLDASEAAVTQVRERGLEAHLGSLPHLDWTSERFEAITMRQSLEHTHQPLDTLRDAYRLLTPGGNLLVAVPNFESWGSRVFGSAWYGLDLPRHLTHFTPATLRLMLEQAGFSHLAIRQEQHNSWIRHSAERRAGMMARVLRTRLGSGIAGAWGRLLGCAEGIAALAIK